MILKEVILDWILKRMQIDVRGKVKKDKGFRKSGNM